MRSSCGYCRYFEDDGELMEQCDKCKAQDRLRVEHPSLNQPSPLVKAEALALLDSAFEEEFDLLPEDAKPLCDTFYRGLRKRLGHPVEAAIERPAAVIEALRELDARLRQCFGLPITAEEAYDSFYQDIVSEALSEARG